MQYGLKIILVTIFLSCGLCLAQTSAPATQKAAMTDKDAQAALQIFINLYADEFRTSAISPDKKDDIETANKFLSAAKAVKSQPALLWLLCSKCYELASVLNDGYLVAADAMQLVIDNVPEKKAEAMDNLLAVLQKHIAILPSDKRKEMTDCFVQMSISLADLKAASDDHDGAIKVLLKAQSVAGTGSSLASELKSRVEILTESQKSSRQVEQMIAAVKADPKDANARNQLVTYLVVELNQPARAVEFLSDAVDEKNRSMVPLAAKKAEEIGETDMSALADWYKQLAAKASSQTGKFNTLTRAKGYYDSFLAKHSAEDLARATAVLACKQVDTELAKIPVPGAPVKPAQPVLKGMKVFVITNSINLDGELVALKKHFADTGIVATAASPQTFSPDQIKQSKVVLILDFNRKDRPSMQKLTELLTANAIPCIVSAAAMYADAQFFKQLNSKSDVSDTISIKDSKHPLSAGFAKDVKVLTDPSDIVWMLPCDPAIPIATLGDDGKAVVLGVEKGAKPSAEKKDGSPTATPSAPGRRVIFNLLRPTLNFAKLTPDGWKLMDAAIIWAASGN